MMSEDLKASREELLKVKGYITGIIALISDGVIVLDPQGKVSDLNPAAADLLGYSQDELAGRSAADIFLEGDKPFESSRLVDLLKKEKVLKRRMHCRSKAKVKIPVLFSASGMKEKDGSIVFVVCTLRDMTGVEEETPGKKPLGLREIQDQLVQAESMETVRRLASRVAHEIKNPLAIILQCADYLMKKVKTDDENISFTLGHIKDAVKRADDVTSGLYDFSSLTEFDFTVCAFNPVVERVLFLVKHQFDKHDIQLAVDLDENLNPITIDVNKIEQALVNLFMNSLSAMPQGGKLKVRTYSSKDEEDEAVVVFKVEDTSKPISEETLVEIFKPFFARSRKSSRTGLALSIVRHITELHRGRMLIENNKGGVMISLIFRVKGRQKP